MALSALLPQIISNNERIDFALLPPPSLITGRVIFAVVDGAERHGEFVADFERNSSRLERSEYDAHVLGCARR